MAEIINNELAQEFESLLLSTHREGIDKLIAYLKLKTDFFSAPASTRFHSSCPGGLLQHSMNVYKMLKAKSQTETWKSTLSREDTIIIVSLLHDICKANFYSVEMRNRKNEDGVWEKYPFYIIDDKNPYGHGEKSVMMIMEFMKLTAEEKICNTLAYGFFGTKRKL